MITISSQRHIDDAIVASKIASEDFEVQVSPWFEHDGMTIRVVLDGHHSYAAAIEAGVEPIFAERDATEHDAICLLEGGDAEGFLQATHMGDDYYNIATGRDIW